MAHPRPAWVSNHVAMHHFIKAMMQNEQDEKKDIASPIKNCKNVCSGHTCRLWNQQKYGLTYPILLDMPGWEIS